MFAANDGKIPSALPDPVANHFGAASTGRIGAKADVDQRVAEDLALVHFDTGTTEVIGARDGLVPYAASSVRMVETKADIEGRGRAEDVDPVRAVVRSHQTG